MLLAGAAALLGAVVQSATGFGFALVLSPVLFAVLDPVEAITTLLLAGLALNVLVLADGGREVDWGRLAPLLAAALPGLVAGIVLLTELPKAALQIGVGVAVIAAAIVQLRAVRLPLVRSGPVVGFTSGALSTSLGVSGPPIVLWLESHGVSPVEFRATLASSFLVLNLAGGALVLAAEGGAALDLEVAVPLLALVLAGHVIGALAFRRIDVRRFFPLVLALVVCAGAASIAAGLAGI